MLPDKYGEWRPIPSEPHWWASSLGYVKRERAPSLRRPDLMAKETRPTRGYPRPTCYVIPIMQPGGALKTRMVGRLVCEAFHGPPPGPNFTARHIDFNPFNNQADNLRWSERRADWPERSAGLQRARTTPLPPSD